MPSTTTRRATSKVIILMMTMPHLVRPIKSLLANNNNNNNTLFKYTYAHKPHTLYIFEKVDREVIPIKGPLTEL